MAEGVRRRQPRPRAYEAVAGALASFPEPLDVYRVGPRQAEALALEQNPRVMYLLLQRRSSWSAARRARRARREAGAGDVDTFWQDDADWSRDGPPPLAPAAGESLTLRGSEENAVTVILSVQAFPSARRVDTVVVGCQRVVGMRIPAAAH